MPDDSDQIGPDQIRIAGWGVLTREPMLSTLPSSGTGRAAKANVVANFEGDGIVVVRRSVANEHKEAGPVYKTAAGALAVPTGRAFVVFRDGEKAGDHSGDIERAGFRVVELPGYAPNAAWVEPSSGRIADGLRRAETLVEATGAVSAEPQILTLPRAHGRAVR